MNDHKRFRLPEGVPASVDPVKSNPYPPEHPAHQVWNEATRKAEYEICRIDAEACSRITPENAAEWFQTTLVAKFDVWAERGGIVVWSDEELRKYDRWLVSHANHWIDHLSSYFAADKPPFAPEVVLEDLRDRLVGRVAYWKAVARRFLMEIEKQPQAVSTSAVADGRSTVPSAAVIRRRRTAFQRYRAAHGLEASAAARKIGLSDTAVRGIIREDRTRFNAYSQEKLLAALGMTLDEWYRE